MRNGVREQRSIGLQSPKESGRKVPKSAKKPFSKRKQKNNR